MTNNARYIIWICGIIFIILIIVGMIAVVKAGNGNKVGDGVLKVPVAAADWTRGSATSTVTLVEYSDFQCPACGSYFPIVEQLIAEKGNDFLFVYRHFPLITIHPNAEIASIAAEAAGRQGKFWEMHQKLFSTQVIWSRDAKAEVTFTQYAAELGLDTTKFAADLKDETLRTKINDQYKGGRDSGVMGTPSFFVNGKLIQSPQSIEEFKAIIDAAKLEATSASTTPVVATSTPLK